MSQDRDTGEARFGTACFGSSAKGGDVHRCKTPPRWQTTQDDGANPINACGRHIAWLLAMRTSPGHSITVTRLP